VGVSLALAVPLGSQASATTMTTESSGKGQQIQVGFSFNDTVSCDAGTFPVQTFMSILSFENTIRSGGQTTTTLTTNLFLGNFSPCGSFFEFKAFNGVGTLSMTALNSASLTGHFVFDDGTSVDLNLTFAGTDTTTQGNSMNRTRMPHFMTMTRTNGSTRNATMGGSITSNGNVVGAGSFIDPDAVLFRNNSGQITVVRF
jgi:hypothetical protein